MGLWQHLCFFPLGGRGRKPKTTENGMKYFLDFSIINNSANKPQKTGKKFSGPELKLSTRYNR
jgi:hypothetical protein